MIVEGERVRSLVSAATSEVILCAPFIKKDVVEILLDSIPPEVSLLVSTRWRPAEVAAGLSDLAVLDLVQQRPNSELRLLDPLHAKLYVADDECLVGSANLTATALGWRRDANIELLVPMMRSDPNVALLIDRLRGATLATFQLRDEVQILADALDDLALDEAKELPADRAASAARPWLPRCAAPDKLHAIFVDPETTTVAADTRTDGLADIEDLIPTTDLALEEFTIHVRTVLIHIPSVGRFLDEIPAGLPDHRAESIVADLRPDLSPTDVRRQWQILREWIGVFFQDQFEVAPKSFVVRLKPH